LILGDNQIRANEQAPLPAEHCFSVETVMLSAAVDRELTHD